MTLTGYRLSGNAKTADPGYFPSLIGVEADQITPAGSDAYFEQIDLPPAAINLNSVALTRWVSYDSLPQTVRDPIVAAKGGGVGFYITLSELIEMVAAHGDSTAQAMVATLRKGAFA